MSSPATGIDLGYRPASYFWAAERGITLMSDACLEVNFEGEGYPREDVQGFIVDASSSFYAEFEDLVRARVDDWLDTIDRLEEDGED